MDRKSIIVIILCLALLVSWGWLRDTIFPPTTVPVPTNQLSSATNVSMSAATNQSGAPISGTNGAVTSAGVSNVSGAFVVHSEIPEQLLVVSNENARYTFTSRGGGLSHVDLVHYPETVSSHKKAEATNDFAVLHTTISPPVLAILGDASLQGDGVFTLTQPTNGVVRAEKSFTNGLTLIKEFRFDTNYLLAASVRFENHSKEPLAIPATEWVAGTSTPMGPQDSGVIGQSVLWYNGSKMNSVNLGYFNTNTTTVFVFPRTPLTEYRAGANDVTWLSPQNQYFALATMLPTNKPAAAVVVHMINLPPPSQAEIDANPRTVRAPKGLESVLVYPAMTLSPGQSSETALNLFAGPKEYQTLARLSARFNNDIDQIMSFGWFGWISKTLLLVMDWMHGSFALNFGLIIIIITIVIRLIYWPLTQASTRSMKRMQALQPQVKALQEKYKDDPQKFSQKQIELWRKNKVSPLSSCLPMVLQVPVFIAFYGMLRNAIELRGETFLWIQDLSKPDTLFVLPGFNFPVNPMPLIMGVTMLVQSHMVPPSPGMDPGQQKIMRYMPLMMLVFMYNLSSGLALYWTVSNLITILQTRLTRTQTNPAAATPIPVSVAPQKKKK